MLDRRALLAFFATTGLGHTLLPGVLWAQMQPGTKKVTLEMVRESARLAGLAWTDEECLDLVDSLSSLARGAEGIDKPTLTNASPLPMHFDPNPPGVAPRPLPPATFRVEPAPRVRRPQNLAAVAFWPSPRTRRMRWPGMLAMPRCSIASAASVASTSAIISP